MPSLPPLTAERRVAVRFGLALLILLGAGVLSDLTLRQSADSARRVDQTRIVIEKVDAFIAALREVENTQGAFLLASNDLSLQAFQLSISRLQQHANELHSLTAASPSEQDLVNRLRPLLARLVPAPQAPDTDFSRSIANMRLLARQLRENEFRILHHDSEQVWLRANRARVILVPAMAAAGILLAYAVISLYRETRLRVQTARELLESEERHQFAVHAAGVGTWSWDLVSDKWLCSDNYTRMLGLPPGVAFNYSVFDQALHPDDRVSTRNAVDHSLGTGAEFDVEYRAVWPNGTIRWLRAKGSPYRNSAGESIRFEGIVIDVNERKLAELALQRSERRYTALFANKINAIAHCRMINDSSGNPVDYEIVQVNHAYELITGIKKPDIEGKTAREVFPGLESSQFDYIGKYGNIANNGGELSFDIFFEPLEQWLSIYVYSPEPGEFIAIFTDITQQKKMEEAIRTSEERFRQLADHIEEVFWVVDPLSGKGLYVSPAYEKVWGRPPEDPYSENPKAWLHSIRDDHRDRVREAFLRAVDSGTFDETYAICRPDGSHRWVWDRGWAIRNSHGQVYRLVGVAEDITVRRHAQEEIERLNHELERRVIERTAELQAANHELEAFAYSVSHDLRAPLRGIDGFARILVEEYAPHLEPKLQRYLHLVRSETQRMGQLIDDLLSFSRLSRQRLNRQPVQVESMIWQVWQQLESERQGRDVQFIVGHLPPCDAEPAMLKQIWVNLLSNALKFSRKSPQPRIEVGSLPSGNGSSGSVYFIKDNGVGFDMRYAAKLFDVFQRLHRAEDYEGTGVGLAIVQRVVRRHGGEIRAHAQPNQGAQFFFTLEAGLCLQSENGVQHA